MCSRTKGTAIPVFEEEPRETGFGNASAIAPIDFSGEVRELVNTGMRSAPRIESHYTFTGSGVGKRRREADIRIVDRIGGRQRLLGRDGAVLHVIAELALGTNDTRFQRQRMPAKIERHIIGQQYRIDGYVAGERDAFGKVDGVRFRRAGKPGMHFLDRNLTYRAIFVNAASAPTEAVVFRPTVELANRKTRYNAIDDFNAGNIAEGHLAVFDADDAGMPEIFITGEIPRAAQKRKTATDSQRTAIRLRDFRSKPRFAEERVIAGTADGGIEIDGRAVHNLQLRDAVGIFDQLETGSGVRSAENRTLEPQRIGILGRFHVDVGGGKRPLDGDGRVFRRKIQFAECLRAGQGNDRGNRRLDDDATRRSGDSGRADGIVDPHCRIGPDAIAALPGIGRLVGNRFIGRTRLAHPDDIVIGRGGLDRNRVGSVRPDKWIEGDGHPFGSRGKRDGLHALAIDDQLKHRRANAEFRERGSDGNLAVFRYDRQCVRNPRRSLDDKTLRFRPDDGPQVVDGFVGAIVGRAGGETGEGIAEIGLVGVADRSACRAARFQIRTCAVVERNIGRSGSGTEIGKASGNGGVRPGKNRRIDANGKRHFGAGSDNFAKGDKTRGGHRIVAGLNPIGAFFGAVNADFIQFSIPKIIGAFAGGQPKGLGWLDDLIETLGRGQNAIHIQLGNLVGTIDDSQIGVGGTRTQPRSCVLVLRRTG